VIRGTRYVITAGHCLPALPPAASAQHAHEATWRILSPLGEPASVLATCCFVDPVTDLAVLCQPDDQAWSAREIEGWEALVDAADVLDVADASNGPVTIAGLDGTPQRFEASTVRHVIWLDGPRIAGGMSGSPIVSAEGKAIGVCVTGGDDAGTHGPQPHLRQCLPGRMQ
jgi:hypothetical protein